MRCSPKELKRTQNTFSVICSHFKVTSGQMTSFPGHFSHVRSHEDISCRLTDTCKLQPCWSSNVNKMQVFSPPEPLAGDFRSNDHFWVTSDHVRARDVISCNMTATSCELQPCRSSNVHKTQVFNLLQPLPGDFRSNDVIFGPLLVT